MATLIIAGLVLGSIFAIASTALSFTYTSTGIFNMAFTAQAYLIARFYYFLNTQRRLPSWGAGVIAIGIAGTLLGVLLRAFVFRHLQRSSTIIKIVATIGLAVSLPAIAEIIFGNGAINAAPGLAPEPEKVFHIFGAAITLDQVITLSAVVLIGAGGTMILRLTDVGLTVRGMVDSEAMSSISGINATRVSVLVWAASGFLAGMCGVFIAPQIGLGASNFTLLLSGAFAAIVVARFKNLGIATTTSLLLGLCIGVSEYFLPSTSLLTTGVIASMPLAFMALFIVVDALLHRGSPLQLRIGGPVDTAVHVEIASPHARRRLVDDSATRRRSLSRKDGVHATLPNQWRKARNLATSCVLLVVALFFVPSFWAGLLAAGLVMAIMFVSINLVTGEGGMIWFCQITLAGIGAVSFAWFVGHKVPFVLALIVSGLVTGVAGLVIGILTVRLGDLYIALVTFSAALLIEQLIFTLAPFYQEGAGQTVMRPTFANGDRNFAFLALAVFAILAIVIAKFRQSTTGFALSAVRSNETGSRSLGLSVTSLRLTVVTLAAVVAGLAGALLALYAGTAYTDSYEALGGWVWLAVAVTVGVGSTGAALLGGLIFSIVPGLFLLYLPTSIAEVPTALFGIGAVLVARNPDGILAMHRRQLAYLSSRWRGLHTFEAPPVNAGDEPRSSIEGESVTGTERLAERDLHAGRSLNGIGSAIAVRRQDNLTAPRRTTSDEQVYTEPTALRALDISVRFGGLQALSDVSIDVPRGEITALIGPNGAGKSTLFGVLSGFQPSLSGRVWLDGLEVSTYSPQQRARAGLYRTFQHTALFWTMTVREQVRLGCRSARDPKRVWRDWLTVVSDLYRTDGAYVDWVLEVLALDGVADRNPAELPLGLQKRVEIARAVAASPKVLLLDEPCSGLDPQETGQLASALRQIAEREGPAILLVEHDLRIVMGISRAVTVLDMGRVIARGDPEQIVGDPAVRTAYLGDEMALHG